MARLEELSSLLAQRGVSENVPAAKPHREPTAHPRAPGIPPAAWGKRSVSP